MSYTFNISCFSHPGPRENLEDAAMSIHLQSTIPIKNDKAILVLPDGAGGCKNGKVASRLAARTLLNSLIPHLNDSDELGVEIPLTPAEIITAIKSAFAEANDRIIRQATGDYEGMATTAVCGLIADSTLYIGWVGDSRLYQFQNGHLYRRTHDHSLVQEAMDRGELSPEDASCAPYAHIITKYLGGPSDKGTPSIRICPVCLNDIILLCSDGLTDVIPDNKIAETIRDCVMGNLSFSQLPACLVEQALISGTLDNVTVLAAQVLPENCSVYSENVTDLTCTGAYPVAAAQALSLSMKEF
jgi:protein phosphatase